MRSIPVLYELTNRRKFYSRILPIVRIGCYVNCSYSFFHYWGHSIFFNWKIGEMINNNDEEISAIDDAVGVGGEDSSSIEHPSKKRKVEEVVDVVESSSSSSSVGEASSSSSSSSMLTTSKTSEELERSVGISLYLSDAPGFSGEMKKRYSDFLVNEIDLNNEVVHLTDMETLPQEPVSEVRIHETNSWPFPSIVYISYFLPSQQLDDGF